MSVTLRHEAKFQADETPTLALDLVATNPTIQHRVSYSGVLSGTLDASSTVAVDEVYSDTRALTAGAYTLNLAALTSTLATTKDFTGKKVKAILIAANSANTAGIVVKDGASNPYLIFATSTGETTVYPGCYVQHTFGGNLAAVSSTVKNIDFSSSDTDAEFQIILVVGT
jgi:hypothetical protein